MRFSDWPGHSLFIKTPYQALQLGYSVRIAIESHIMYVYLHRILYDLYFMNQNYETTLKQSSSYATPVIKVVEIEMSQLLCRSTPTDFKPEIDELP